MVPRAIDSCTMDSTSKSVPSSVQAAPELTYPSSTHHNHINRNEKNYEGRSVTTYVRTCDAAHTYLFQLDGSTDETARLSQNSYVDTRKTGGTAVP